VKSALDAWPYSKHEFSVEGLNNEITTAPLLRCSDHNTPSAERATPLHIMKGSLQLLGADEFFATAHYDLLGYTIPERSSFQ
jgi:hypothetical protein